MSKPEGLFFIREIAATCGVSINALRFYEAKKLIKPAFTDPESGYRYYSRQNLLQLRTVLALKGAGLSLGEIKEYLDGKKHTETKITELTQRRDLLNRAIENLCIRAVEPGDLTVHEIELPERWCLCRTIKAMDSTHAITLIGEFYDDLIRQGVSLSRVWPEFCEYPDEGLLKGEFKETDFTITACLPVDKKNAPQEAVLYPSRRAAVINYRGSYYDLWRAYEALNRYIMTHDYIPAGYPQEIYLETGQNGCISCDDVRNITRVIVPVKE
jgi:DNA-binding transcriptional MerR regulator